LAKNNNYAQKEVGQNSEHQKHFNDSIKIIKQSAK
jgi:hypothetical protein